MVKKLAHIFMGLVILSLADGCVGLRETATPEPPVYWPTEDWQTSTPEEQGMDSAKLDEMMEFIDEMDLAIDSVVIVRNGHIVLEEYPDPNYGPDTLHQLYSATKSFTSALIGIAIQEGFIESVDQNVVDLFGERTIANLDSRKQNMTLEHLLTMTTGFEWNAWDPSKPYSSLELWDSPDWVQFTLERPMAYDPGEKWEYCNGASHLLSAIITKTTGYSTLEFAREFLFSPLGISDVKWDVHRGPQGIYCGAHGLELTPRDMAKVGYLYLNNGTWEGEQIVPAEWVARSTETSFLFWENEGYGYQWWTFPQSEIYFAKGQHGQDIFVIPRIDMVVVFTASHQTGYPNPGLLHHFIGAACNTEILPVGRFSKYGFSFDYPSGVTIIEGGIWGQGTASEVSGLLQVVGLSESIKVMWDTAESALELEAVLDKYFAIVKSAEIEVTHRGPLVTSMMDDHEMVYQYYNAKQQAVQYSEVIGSWYCEEADRVYAFTYLSIPETTQQDLLRDFQKHLDSFVCH